jgi:hypothetical protein
MGIKSLELDPTRENVYKTLVADAVGRNKNLWQFACFCSAQESGCSIALDSGWGTGKTFFLKQLQMLFDIYGDKNERVNEDEQKQLQLLFNSYAAEDQLGMTIKHHVCVYYDAWLNDNADDPLHSFLHELIKQTKTCFVKNEKSDYLKTACGIFDAFTGKNTSSLLDIIKDTNPVQDIQDQQSFHERFADFLDNLIPKEHGRLLVLIDELDRCKPTYAVQLLERIKHYLSNDKITFVFAINEKQLLHTIQVFYGDGFDAYQYLDRFFDYRLSLPKPDINQFNKYYGYDQVGEQAKLYSSVCDTFIQEYPLSPREAIKYRQWVKIICDSFLRTHNEAEDKSWRVVMFIIIPVVLGLKIKDNSLYSDFMNGHSSEQYANPLHDIVNSCQIANDYLSHLRPPRMENINGTSQWVDTQNATSCIDTIYKHLFKTPTIYKDPLSKYGFNFKKEMRDAVYLAPSLMADFIKFDTNTEETVHG